MPAPKPKSEAETVLRARGWRRTQDGWRHPKLHHPWPEVDAMRLVLEVNAMPEAEVPPVFAPVRSRIA